MKESDLSTIATEINKLFNLFKENEEKIYYDSKSQEKANKAFDELAKLTNTYEKNIKNEESNIENDLTIIDKKTGKKIPLVDAESMKNRVKSVTNSNNIYSCLKTLALSNKIAHSFDGEIDSCEARFKQCYKYLYPNKELGDITFESPIKYEFPELKKTYKLNSITEDDFDKLMEALNTNFEGKDKGAKIRELKRFNIPYNVKDDDDINEKCNILVKEKNKILSSYLVDKYIEGYAHVQLQNRAFAIKDKYISMIGQLLSKNVFGNIPFELVKNSSGKSGFNHLLVIDDRDLSYYIEVHMPDIIGRTLIKDYNFELSEERKLKHVRASAVYYRDRKEVKNIRKALKEYPFKNPARAEIIARGNDDEPDGGKIDYNDDIVIEQNSNTSTQNEDYSFITEKIDDKPKLSLIENFLIDEEIYANFVNKSRLNYLNENIPINVTKSILNKNYNVIFNSFNDNYKNEFINYSYNKIKNGDIFEKKLYNIINEDNLIENTKFYSKLFMNLDNFKEKFVKDNLYLFKNYKDNDNYYNKDLINNEIDNYIENYIESNINEKPKRRR